MRVLVIEDNRDISKNVQRYLEVDGWSVDTAFDGISGLEKALREPYSIVLLDCMLPGMDGLSVCKKLRMEKDVPIIVTTAIDDKKSIVSYLENGADDYLTKPFDLKELETRMFAILRRTENRNAATPCEFGNVRIDFRKRTAEKNGYPVHLYPKEFRILEYLVANEGVTVSRSDIIEYVWGGDGLFEKDRLDVYVSGIRKKLGPDVIETVKGHGYVFTPSRA